MMRHHSAATLLLVGMALFGLAGCPPSQPPLAAFRANPTTGDAPMVVQFTDLSLPGGQAITGWLWDFGDGNTSTEQNPLHVYEENGLYPVSLTVSSPAGSTTLTLNDHILVGFRFRVHLVNNTAFPIQKLYVDAADAGTLGPNRLSRDIQPGESITLARQYVKGLHIVRVVLSAEIFAITRAIPGNMRTLEMPDEVVTVEVFGEDAAEVGVVYRFGLDSGPA